MACPLFEPRTRVNQGPGNDPRLPLIYEFEGICHAGESVIDPLHRFKYCNRGNAKGHCRNLPSTLDVSAIRFSVTRSTPQTLTVLVIEEQDHWARSWTTVHFKISEQQLEPEMEDVCRRAQVFQFCVSYLEKTK